MVYGDILGSAGIGLILLAYFLNISKLIIPNGKTFFVLNIFGGALACYAALRVNYWPFVMLHGAWIIVSVYGLMKTMRIKMT
jgi:hypothetical protein